MVEQIMIPMKIKMEKFLLSKENMYEKNKNQSFNYYYYISRVMVHDVYKYVKVVQIKRLIFSIIHLMKMKTKQSKISLFFFKQNVILYLLFVKEKQNVLF